jgi:hypothetical protein
MNVEMGVVKCDDGCCLNPDETIPVKCLIWDLAAETWG